MKIHSNIGISYNKDYVTEIINNEVQREAENQLSVTSNTFSLIDILTRATRSKLETKRIDINDSYYTNCIGSIMQLTKELISQKIYSEPALLIRQPWELEESERGVHIVAAIRANNDNYIIADPTSMAGYSYGRVSLGSAAINGSNIVQNDDKINGFSNIKILSQKEFEAIQDVYRYEISSDDEYSEDRKNVVLDCLINIPVYRAKMIRQIAKKTNDGDYIELLNRIPPTSLRFSYLKDLSKENRVQLLEIKKEENINFQKLIPKINHLIETSQTIGEYCYWNAVMSQNAGNNFQHANNYLNLKPRDFICVDNKNPIKAYEKYVYEEAPYSAVSNLYSPKVNR